MNAKAIQPTLIAAILAAALLAGCSSNQARTQAPPASAELPPVADTTVAGGPTESGAAVTAAGTVAGIWTQIEGEQAKLSTVIENGQLKDVHHLAFGIRDLAVALAEKAGAGSPAVAARLKSSVDLVKASASKLDELGDAGNLSGTQAEQAKLTTVLNAIHAVVSAK